MGMRDMGRWGRMVGRQDGNDYLQQSQYFKMSPGSCIYTRGGARPNVYAGCV